MWNGSFEISLSLSSSGYHLGGIARNRRGPRGETELGDGGTGFHLIESERSRQVPVGKRDIPNRFCSYALPISTHTRTQLAGRFGLAGKADTDFSYWAS